MNILFTALRFHPNQQIASKVLIEKKHEIHYLVLMRLSHENHSNVKTKVLKKNNIKKIYQQIKEINPSLVIIRGRTLFSMNVFLVTKILGIPSLRYEQVVLETDKSFIHKKLPSFLFKTIKFFQNFLLPSILITPIAKNPNVSYEWMNKKKRFFLPLPIELKKEGVKKRNKFFSILVVAKFDVRKNHLLFLQAIKNLGKEFNIRATLIGFCNNNTHLKTIKEFVKKEKLEKKVTFKINIPHTQVLKEYQEHDLFVLPSYDEEFAYSPQEAIANNVPVLISSDQGNKYVIPNNIRREFVFENNSLEDLTNKLRILIKDEKRRKEGLKKMRQEIKRNHSPEKYLETFNNILKQVKSR